MKTVILMLHAADRSTSATLEKTTLNSAHILAIELEDSVTATYYSIFSILPGNEGAPDTCTLAIS